MDFMQVDVTEPLTAAIVGAATAIVGAATALLQAEGGGLHLLADVLGNTSFGPGVLAGLPKGSLKLRALLRRGDLWGTLNLCEYRLGDSNAAGRAQLARQAQPWEQRAARGGRCRTCEGAAVGALSPHQPRP